MPYTVFRLHPINEDGTCGCREGAACDRPGKHPAIQWKDLEAGARVYGSAGHGLATGVRSDVFVIDTDGPAADERFRALCDEDDLDTYTVATPSGGRHYYFRWPGFPVRNSVGEVDWSEEQDGYLEGTKRKSTCIDVRGDGGFVVLPGSPHKSGRAYKAELNVAPGEAPAWLLSWAGLRGRLAVDGEGVWRPFPVDLASDLGRKRHAMGQEACETYQATSPDSVNTLWNLSLRLVRDLELPLEACAELVATVFNPRCTPAWSLEAIQHKLEDARDKSDRIPGFVTDFDLSKAVKASAAPSSEPAKRRKAKDPTHRYTCALSSVGAYTPAKTSFGKVIDILSGNVADWEGVLQYDEFQDRILAVDPPIALEAEKTCFVDRDVTAVRKWFEVCAGLVVAKDAAWEAVVSVAHANKFHPVREYLQDLPPGDPSHLDQAASLFFGSTDPLDRVLVRKFMIGAVRRILNPGEKLDTMLVLVGDQGAFKSSFVPELFGRDWTSEDLADLKTKDAMIGLAGKWAIEVGELDKILRHDPETVKAFISRQVDPYRAPYERVSTDHPRQCCYVGTSNMDDFLRDPTGERRYWIVDIRKTGAGVVDLAAVRAWRDRLWAAAYVVATVNKYEEPHWLSPTEAAALKTRASFYKGEDGWQDAIESYCTGREFVTAEGVWKTLGGTTDKLEKKQTDRITRILRELGCTKGVQGGKHSRKRGWLVPPELQVATVPSEEANRRAGSVIMKEILGTS